MDRDDVRTIDDWLDDSYELRTHRDYNDDDDQPEILWFDWEDDEQEDEDIERLALPDGFHALDQLDRAPLQIKIDDALTELSRQLAQGHTQGFRDLIAFYARFHRYSLPNTMLIMLQKPDAEAIAGYRRWQQLGRQVRKGARSAQIWCPMFRRASTDATDDDQSRLIGFRTGYVFSDKDLQDADTNPLPRARSPLPDNHQDLLAVIRERVIVSGVAIRDEDHIFFAEGYYTRASHEIVLEIGKDSHNQILILLHEWAHALFHREAADWPKAQKEFEAETSAMVVGAMLGLEAPAAADYLLTFGATPEQLQISFGRVHRLVKEMSAHLGLNVLDGELDE